MLRAKCGSTNRTKLAASSWLFFNLMGGLLLWIPSGIAVCAQEKSLGQTANENQLTAWEGKPVLRIEFAGVPTTRLDPLPEELPQQPGAPLRADNLRESLRRLYATGLYDSISA
jgi:outer membrane protein assembly factor BamA